MSHRFWLILLLVAVSVGSSAYGVFYTQPTQLFAATTTAQRQAELAAQKKALEAQIKQKEAEEAEKNRLAKEQEERRKAEVAQANAIGADIKKTEANITKTEGEIGKTEQAIAQKKEEIKVVEGRQQVKQDEIDETIIALYEDQGSQFYNILAYDRLSRFLDSEMAYLGLSDKLVADAEELDEQRRLLLAIVAELHQKENDLESQKKQLAAYQKALDEQKKVKIQLAEEAKAAKQEFLTQASEAKKVSESLKKQFAAVVNEEAAMRRGAGRRGVATANRSSNPSGLGFIWPVDGMITTYFGGSTPFQNFHSGLDIAGPAGDPIVAAHDGIVTTVTTMCCTSNGKDYGYGNWVEIEGTNGYVTRYAHLLGFEVAVGQQVKRGQTIGYRGGGIGMRGAGWSTGPHLHFEIRDSLGAADPLQFLPN